MKAILRFLFLALFPVALYSQSNKTVKGVVTDENKNPLSGVSVTVKGTRKATVTDADGRFSLSVPGSDAMLVFSYVGYSAREVAAGDGETLAVSLSGRGSQMNDVVV